MNVKIVKVMARYGTPSSLIGAILIGISIVSTENWSFRLNTLSELGVMGRGGGLAYNSGLLIAGGLAMLLAAAFFEFTNGDSIGQVGSAVFFGYSLSICILGVTLLDLGDWVDMVSQGLYVIIPVSSLLLSYNLYIKGLQRYAALGAVATLAGAVFWIMGGPVNAVNQVVALAPFSVWQLATGRYMTTIEEPNEWD